MRSGAQAPLLSFPATAQLLAKVELAATLDGAGRLGPMSVAQLTTMAMPGRPRSNEGPAQEVVRST
jgi:hypothetical protein